MKTAPTLISHQVMWKISKKLTTGNILQSDDYGLGSRLEFFIQYTIRYRCWEYSYIFWFR